jgi:AcrR family transcriptional regulator
MRRSYHHGRLAEALVEATLKAVKQYGVRGVSLTAVAKVAGVTAAASYRHFADKDALLAAAAQSAFTSFYQHLLTVPQMEFDAQTYLAALGQAYVEFAAASPEMMELMFHTRLDWRRYPQLAEVASRAFKVLEDGVRRLAEEGRISFEEVNQMTYLLWYAEHGVATLGVAAAGPCPPEASHSMRAMSSLLLSHLPPSRKRKVRQRQVKTNGQ